MKRMQFLRAAGAIGLENQNNRTLSSARVTATGIDTKRQIMKDIERLTFTERSTLANQVGQQLSRERRRCNGNAVSYDVNRHIRLYLMDKALKPLT